jgi:carboxypeptidase Q
MQPTRLLLISALAACTPRAAAPPIASYPVAVSTPVPSPPVVAEAPAPMPDDVRDLQRGILGGHGAVDAVASLTTEVGARLAGSPGDKLAVAWALRAMHERGLSNVHSEPVKVPVWQRGVETASIVAPVSHVLAVVALGWSGATGAKGAIADVVRFDSLDALKSADARSVAGKIVFLDVKMRVTADMPGYADAVPARSSGPGEAAKNGAIAIVVRSIGSDDTRAPHTGSMHREKDEKSALPAGALSNADADLLERVLVAHGSARVALHLEPRWLPDAESANVVGDIPGRERPGEIVLMGAHLDSWDLGEGAIDDGAGCGIVLEAGRALAALGQKPRRTVRVVLFAAEENSLSGGKEYARAHATEAQAHVATMEADSGTGRVQAVHVVGAARLPTAPPSLHALGVQMIDGPGHGGADVTPLHALGVPMVDLHQDPARYFDFHHTANDTFARIDATALTQSAAAFATMAWTIANMDGDLGRVADRDRGESN